MKNKIGLVLSHIHVRSSELHRFDMLEYVINFFKNRSDFFIVLSGHGIEPPPNITKIVDKIYWENQIDNNEIGRGHPRFCIESFNILNDLGIEKTIKLRYCDLILNIDDLLSLLKDNDLILSEQTCFTKRMIGDLFMAGSTKKLLDMWTEKQWDYSKSGLYNLYDNMESISHRYGLEIYPYLKQNCLFLKPQNIKWVTLEGNWNSATKNLNSEMTDDNLWGAKQGFPYYGGF